VRSVEVAMVGFGRRAHGVVGLGRLGFGGRESFYGMGFAGGVLDVFEARDVGDGMKRAESRC
jgi:hypothetical protein